MIEKADHLPHTSLTNVRWKILILISLASCISYILRTNLSIIGETMVREFGITEIQLGHVLAAFAWGYAIFQFPGGIFGDIVGSRKAITFMALSWGVLTILTGLVPTPPLVTTTVLLVSLIVIRFLVGALNAPIFPVIGAVIANWFPVGGWGFPNGLTSSALTLGSAVGAPLIVWLAGLYGWRECFFYTAPLGFFIAAIWWWYGRDYPAMHRSVSAAELQLINQKRESTSDEPTRYAWKAALKNREILLLTFSYFCMNYIFYLVFNWFFFIWLTLEKLDIKKPDFSLLRNGLPEPLERPSVA